MIRNKLYCLCFIYFLILVCVCQITLYCVLIVYCIFILIFCTVLCCAAGFGLPGDRGWELALSIILHIYMFMSINMHCPFINEWIQKYKMRKARMLRCIYCLNLGLVFSGTLTGQTSTFSSDALQVLTVNRVSAIAFKTFCSKTTWPVEGEDDVT